MTPNISVYNRCMLKIASYMPSKSRYMFLHPAGPTTIFFWAPLFKWGLVLAGLGDLERAAHRTSLGQAMSLTLSGAVWARYALVIIPKNYNLFSVNLFIFCTSGYNTVRTIIHYLNKKNNQTTIDK
ncbi:hypothetical protein HN011_004006 [Eciton burchellii]|nr:hypothetical protein HN011_004006 [Eciton burchellii]